MGTGSEKWGKVQGIRSINGRYKVYGGGVKNSMGNGEAKELICMIHGHELREGGAGQKGIKQGKWDNCNNIINKIY